MDATALMNRCRHDALLRRIRPPSHHKSQHPEYLLVVLCNYFAGLECFPAVQDMTCIFFFMNIHDLAGCFAARADRAASGNASQIGKSSGLPQISGVIEGVFGDFLGNLHAVDLIIWNMISGIAQRRVNIAYCVFYATR